MSSLPKLTPLKTSVEKTVKKILRTLGRTKQPREVRAAKNALLWKIAQAEARLGGQFDALRAKKTRVTKELTRVAKRNQRLEYLDYEPHRKLERLRKENEKLGAEARHLRTRESARKNTGIDRGKWQEEKRQFADLLRTAHAVVHLVLKPQETNSLAAEERKKQQMRLIVQIKHLLDIECDLCDKMSWHVWSEDCR